MHMDGCKAMQLQAGPAWNDEIEIANKLRTNSYYQVMNIASHPERSHMRLG